MPDSKMTRMQFLKGAAACGIGVGVSHLFPGRGFAQSTDPIERLLDESLVIDGLVAPHVEYKAGWPRSPGVIKSKTGINVGSWLVPAVEHLSYVNDTVEYRKNALMRIDSAADIEKTRETGLHGLVFYAQQGWKLDGSLEPLTRWHEGGLRVLQIAHRDENELGGGSEHDAVRLTALGVKAVAELNRLGIVIDVSYCGRRTTLDVARASDRPIMASQTGASELTDHPATKSDKELKAIAATGGVIGVSIAGRFIRSHPERQGTVTDFLAHIDHIVQLVGIDHVGVSTSGLMNGGQHYKRDETDSLLNTYSRWENVARELKKKGYSDEDVQKILGLNFFRVYQRVFA